MKLAALIAGLVALLGAARTAEAACKRGALLFRFETAPLDGAVDGAAEVIEVRTTGRWTRTGATAGSGCLAKATLARVKKAVKRARLEHRAGVGVCDAVSTAALRYRSARGTVESETPCGREVDEGTAIAGRCVAEATLSQPDAERVAEACAPPAKRACKRGALLLRLSRRSLPAATGDDAAADDVIEVRSAGAWSRREGGVESRGGCLPSSQLRWLRQAVKRARFRKAAPEGSCRDAPDLELTYQGARSKQRVAVTAPCGDTLDAGTQLAHACLIAVTLEWPVDRIAEQCGVPSQSDRELGGSRDPD